MASSTVQLVSLARKSFAAAGDSARAGCDLREGPGFRRAAQDEILLFVDQLTDLILSRPRSGTERGMQAYRDAFADFAEANDCIVLAPLFPAGITGPGELSSYKLLRAGALHDDAVLLSMVDELQEKYRLEDERFLLYGFSGGGHFTHRFLYLHPEHLRGASIGAPGVVTLLDHGYDFWVGVRDFEARFGKRSTSTRSAACRCTW
jgi:pimeloyl-ACP methyl ester carboxylesterase